MPAAGEAAGSAATRLDPPPGGIVTCVHLAWQLEMRHPIGGCPCWEWSVHWALECPACTLVAAAALPRPEVRATDAFLNEGAQERRRALLEEMLLAADRGSMSWDGTEAGLDPLAETLAAHPCRACFTPARACSTLARACITPARACSTLACACSMSG